MTAATTITVTDEPGPVVERLKAETTARLAAILNDGTTMTCSPCWSPMARA